MGRFYVSVGGLFDWGEVAQGSHLISLKACADGVAAPIERKPNFIHRMRDRRLE